MAQKLLGKEVNEALTQWLQTQTETLCREGIIPTLAIVRVGARPDDIGYEKSALEKGKKVGVAVKVYALPETASREMVLETIDSLNSDSAVHGVLIFQPFPQHLRDCQREICNRLDPKKDVDGLTDLSAAGVYQGTDLGYAPCTPSACMEILDHYGIDCKGKRVAVIGRSLVVGKPVAMMLMGRHATVTVCHTRTVDTAAICREADMIVSSAGAMNSLTRDHVRPGQIVLDVSTNWNEKTGKLVGDAVYEEVEPVVSAITPVPGGVGAVTTNVLMKHVVMAAQKVCK